MLPAWAVDEVIEHWPDRCACGHVFCDAERLAVGAPARHQVEELPVIAVRMIEHQCQRVRCPSCGARATGPLPAAVADSAFGARLQAAIVTLSVRNRVSRRDVVELCEQLFSARVSTGSVEAMLQRAGDALADPYEDLLARVRAAKALNMDETGWRLHGNQRALWGAFTERHALFRIAADRDEDRARELLGHSDAVVTSDRWWAYGHLPLRRRQICWAARNLLKAWPALWTFATVKGVEPTNNHAERALRGAVIYRKLSLGSQSERGEQRIARLLSAHTTCRLQRRSFHAYLIDAITAHTRGDPAPLLA